MVDLTNLVKAEKTTSSDYLNLRRMFEKCGDIRAIHASGFIEFERAESAVRALALEISGVRVFDVASSARLTEQYRKVNPSAFAERPRQRPLTEDKPKSQPPPSACSSSLLRTLHAVNKPVSNRSHPERPSTQSRRVSSSAPSLSVGQPAVPKAKPNHISMRLCGELISLDLATLPADPTTTIELLRNVTEDRGNWFSIAAYYRSTGNPQSAKQVMAALLEALKEFNIPDDGLKPAFLLLAGCETDLAKAQKAKGDSGKASEHYNSAETWLRKVYGIDIPPPAEEANVETASSKPASAGYRNLERELQSLRDKNAHNKRKLEESLSVEREVRRRLEDGRVIRVDT
ncbi:40S ribosomal protein [Mycena chlorophos]|uniref:40S ribosomal protein n=1 Tax=Mycena chlorophos TaxID=658473 RepID=A0A8H6SWV6_MYCCL|nr:40S ribosomal protein [Mycena chlorophos]